MVIYNLLFTHSRCYETHCSADTDSQMTLLRVISSITLAINHICWYKPTAFQLIGYHAGDSFRMTDETLRTSGYLLSLFFCAKSCFWVSDGTVCSGKEFRFRIGAAPYLPRFSALRAEVRKAQEERRKNGKELKNWSGKSTRERKRQMWIRTKNIFHWTHKQAWEASRCFYGAAVTHFVQFHTVAGRILAFRCWHVDYETTDTLSFAAFFCPYAFNSLTLVGPNVFS